MWLTKGPNPLSSYHRNFDFLLGVRNVVFIKRMGLSGACIRSVLATQKREARDSGSRPSSRSISQPNLP